MSENEKPTKTKIITKELWGMVLTLFNAVCLFCLFTGKAVFYPLGETVQLFLLGVFGYFAFPLFVFLTLAGVMMIIGKNVVKGRGLVTAIAFSLLVINVFLLLHLALFSPENTEFGEYVSSSYNYATPSIKASVGGAVGAIVVYPVFKIASSVGSVVIFSAIIFLSALIALKDKIFKKENTSAESKTENAASGDGKKTYANADDGELPRQKANSQTSGNGRRLVFGDSTFELKEESEEKDDIGYTPKREEPITYSREYERSFSEKLDYVKTPQKIDPENLGKPVSKTMFSTQETKSTEYVPPVEDESDFSENVYIPDNYRRTMDKMSAKAYDAESDDDVNISDEVEGVDKNATDDTFSDESDFGFEENTDNSGEADSVSEFDDDGLVDDRFGARKTEFIRPIEKPERTFSTEKSGSDSGDEDKTNPYDKMPLNFKYNAPPIEILRDYEQAENYGAVEMFKQTKAEIILNTFKLLNNINVKVVNIVHGPTVTRFDLAIPDNVSIKNIVKYTDDLRLRLKTQNEIRFTTVPGTSYVGVEVANEQQATVGLKEVLLSKEFQNAKPTSLTFAIGLDLVGNPVVADISKMPHLLIAGATGTGKSVGLNSLIISLLYKYSPADLRFIIVDPKQVEFAAFAGMPHMLFDEIIFDTQKTIAMLNWAVKEMESRYALFRESEVKNITEYNMQIDPRKVRKLPQLVIIIDEFADLMAVDKKGVEDKISRLAAKARAAGMYLILATQRPSVNIMEGSIKTNFTSRMAFKMSNAIDSNTILGEGGAEKLLGRGDVLYKMSYMSNTERAQGAFIDTDEIKEVLKYIKANNKCYFNDDALAAINSENAPQIENVTAKSGGTFASDGKGVPKDNLSALYLAIQLGSVSIALLQRKLRFGFPKAGSICDWMERKGYLIDGGTGKRKQVTITMDQFMQQYGDEFSVEEFEDKYGLL